MGTYKNKHVAPEREQPKDYPIHEEKKDLVSRVTKIIKDIINKVFL